MNRVLLVVKGLDLGGVERIVVDLAVGMHRRGWTAEVAVLNGVRSQLVPTLRQHDVPVHVVGASDRPRLAMFRRLTQLIRRGDWSVVHAHGPMATVLTRLAASDAPVVSTSHTPYTSLRRTSRLAWRATCGRDAATLAVSSAVAASLPGRARIGTEVVPHGIDTAHARSVRESAPRSTDGVVRAITVASHREVKNYPNLLRAVASARQAGVRLEVLAVGEGPRLERHRALAVQLGVADVVQFVPPRVDVLADIAAADFLVVASDYEGQPLVVGEALAVGCPVVATAVGRAPELVGPDVGRIVPPQRPDLLAAALVEMAGDADLRARMSEAAMRREAVWSLDDVVDAHLRLYAGLAVRS